MLVAAPAAAQGVPRVESGPHLALLGSRPAQWLAGWSGHWRVGARTRLGGSLAGGWADDRAAWRGEITGHFLAAPAATRGVGWYAGGGIGGSLGEAEGARLVVLVGVDSRPGAGQGWYAELGLAGGVRVVAGWRWRHPVAGR